MTKNHYEILGVNKTASTDEIKVAYRALAKKHHPDTNNNDGSEMSIINQSYTILSDKDKRKIYDYELYIEECKETNKKDELEAREKLNKAWALIIKRNRALTRNNAILEKMDSNLSLTYRKFIIDKQIPKEADAVFDDMIYGYLLGKLGEDPLLICFGRSLFLSFNKDAFNYLCTINKELGTNEPLLVIAETKRKFKNIRFNPEKALKEINNPKKNFEYKNKGLLILSYILMMIGFFTFGVTTLIAIIIDLICLIDTHKRVLISHIRYQLNTFVIKLSISVLVSIFLYINHVTFKRIYWDTALILAFFGGLYVFIRLAYGLIFLIKNRSK